VVIVPGSPYRNVNGFDPQVPLLWHVDVSTLTNSDDFWLVIGTQLREVM
jgi:hypothetical protein